MEQVDIIDALHEGLATAVRDFHNWSGGESIKTFGVESMLTTECARTLATRMREKGPVKPITLEQTFLDIVEFSQRKSGPGRPNKDMVDISNKPTGRVDLVLWHMSNTPQVIIEIKRQPNKANLLADAERVMKFVSAAGRSKEGSVRYGLVASLFFRADSKTTKDVKSKIKDRSEALEGAARKRNMRMKASAPQWIALDEGEDPSICSMVWSFKE